MVMAMMASSLRCMRFAASGKSLSTNGDITVRIASKTCPFVPSDIPTFFTRVPLIAGPPRIQRDVSPAALHAPPDSFVKISVIAQGEPLSYQWFHDGKAMEGATQAFLCISQSIQPHNAGSYFCEISNWQGRVRTITMHVHVVEDPFAMDPSLKYQIPRGMLRKEDIVHRIAAQTGGLLHHCATGATLLLPPHCFQCVNADGDDVSDAVGMEVGMRDLVMRQQPRLRLRHDEQLVSAIIEILPASVPSLLRRATLLIPHSMNTVDPLHHLVVVKVNHVTGECQDLESASAQTAAEIPSSSLEKKQSAVASAEIQAFGAFAVLSRSLPSNRQGEQPTEQVRILSCVHCSLVIDTEGMLALSLLLRFA